MKDKESTRIKIKTDNDSEENIFADSEAAYGLENQAGSIGREGGIST